MIEAEDLPGWASRPYDRLPRSFILWELTYGPTTDLLTNFNSDSAFEILWLDSERRGILITTQT